MGYQSDEPEFHHYRCHLRSVPGMWATYDGHVDVWAPSEDEVFQRAVRQLARTSFPDRPSMSSWRLDRIERL
ncbi:hypothetical protein [Cupriavidus oxalaticus]|uniref:Uncharacterized protein n=1 Tax=Cupriavidus oxalaticus TaxID=96344 RepID=A0A4P7LIZ1_9BURK|nr:hypothetical protein [Cupriavidus oxalaticus]QBY56120.1 hypothetical protein E0W60_34235 [Cupriavidus oxalaticus]